MARKPTGISKPNAKSVNELKPLLREGTPSEACGNNSALPVITTVDEAVKEPAANDDHLSY